MAVGDRIVGCVAEARIGDVPGCQRGDHERHAAKQSEPQKARAQPSEKAGQAASRVPKTHQRGCSEAHRPHLDTWTSSALRAGGLPAI